MSPLTKRHGNSAAVASSVADWAAQSSKFHGIRGGGWVGGAILITVIGIIKNRIATMRRVQFCLTFPWKIGSGVRHIRPIHSHEVSPLPSRKLLMLLSLCPHIIGVLSLACGQLLPRLPKTLSKKGDLNYEFNSLSSSGIDAVVGV
jgi:hypothetical protein